MPPRFSYSEDRMEKILNNLDNSFLNVVEFRHESWWLEDIYKELKKKNITFCGMSHPTLPKDIVANTPLFYYRLHGEGQLYGSNYENSQLQQIVTNIKKHQQIEEAFVFFNNDINTYAVYNAQEMQKMI